MNKKQFIISIAIPATIILIFLSIKMFTVATGEEILLNTVPVDPNDLFRGDYVILNYEISSITISTPKDHEFKSDETIYSVLTKKEKYWTIDSISHTKPITTEGQTCMKGTIKYTNTKNIRITWGIENYFVPEGEGKIIQSVSQTPNLSAIILVDENCNSAIKQLLSNDEPITFINK